MVPTSFQPPSFVPIRFVFFDAGGTLLQPWPSVGAIYAGTAARFGRAYDPADVETRYRRAAHQMRAITKRDDGPPYGTSFESEYSWWRDLVGMVFPEWMGERDFAAFFDALFRDLENPLHFRLMPGALETLDELQRRGCGVGLISNWDRRLRTVLDGLGLATRLDPIVISGEVGVEKPAAKIFEEALRRAGVDARQAVYVGDSYEWDVLGARGAGMRAVLLDAGGGEAREGERAKEVGDFITIAALTDLMQLFPPL